MQTLSIEGAKNDIRVNCLAPTAATRMTEDLGARLDLDTLRPGLVTPGVMFLVSEDAPTRAIMNAGAGNFERTYVAYTRGAYIGGGDDAAERVAAAWDQISDRDGEIVPESGAAQGMNEVQNAMKAQGKN
jgi:NAD(P)-dependent dehydrogenase (short-subunit alcohol dehydrogenase family)